MPRIYDNIENHLSKGLNSTLELSKRSDFCVGYFNLRSWGEVAEKTEALPGMNVVEGEESYHRYCRLLVGMQRLPADILKESFNRDESYLKAGQQTAWFYPGIFISRLHITFHGKPHAELDFIINYDIKYRMGKELEGEEEEEASKGEKRGKELEVCQ